ncbi:MAG: lamin tail domain-containing protein, partial [Anaerolineales bacterium]|nr:lamin tail domain-containing protein [Anaerolineales bacterium]
MLGNHGSHGLNEVIADPDDAGNKVLKVVATGETEHMHNHLETTLKKNDAYYTLNNAQTYRISFRARWLSGVPRLHTRLYFNRAARTTILPVPTQNGTPGAQNSLYTTNWGPQYENLQHSPLIPEANEPVTVKVQAWDADGVQSAVLHWSADNSAFISTTMSLDGDGFYAATIPGQAADTVVQFYVVGEDTLGATTYFPAAGPASRALYEVNDGRAPAADVHNLRIMLTPDDERFFHDDTNVMSNDLIPATVIYNESEVFYDVRIRLKGSQHGRWTDSRASYVIHFPADHLFRGVHNSVKIDRTGVHELIHWQILNRAGGLLGFYNDVVNLMPAKEALTTRAQLVLGGYVDNVMDAQYEDGSSGPQYKLEYIYRTTSTVGGSPEGLKIAQNGVNALPGIQNRGNNPEAYRWNYLMRNNHFENDYQPLIDFIQAADQPTNDFLADIESVIEVDEWLRAFAFLATINMTDHYYNAQHHNSIFYALPSDQRLHLLIWDTDFFEGSATNPVNKNIQLEKLLADPIYARIFYGHLDDFLTVSYNNGYLDQWIQHYRDKTGAVTYFGGAINVTNQQNRVTGRVNYLRGQINTLYPTVAFDITTNGGSAFVTTATSAVLEGTGWINVREIELVNTNTMLEVTWLDADSWQVEVPLVPGANNIQLQAYDFQGKPLNSDIIQITSNPPIELADMSNLLLTEIQYNPQDSDSSYEYLEFKNISAEMVNLGGTTISGAVSYTFPPSTNLAAGEFILVAADLAAFNSRYVDNSSPWYTAGLQVLGPWAGSLSNGGEEIIVTNLDASEILRVTYDDNGAWPGRADGDGSAAELETPAAVPTDTLLNKNSYLDNGNNWRPTSE